MQKFTATESQSFPVTDNPSILVRNQVGEVSVVAGEIDQVTVKATKEVRGLFGEAAQQALEAITVQMEQHGNSVSVQVDLGAELSSVSHRSVRLLVTVPERANLDVEVKVGKLHTYGLTGQVQAQVATGQAELRRMSLTDDSRLLVHTGQVDLDGELLSGASLDVKINVGSAELKLPSTTAAHLDASTNIGHIEVYGWPVAVRRSFLGASASGDMGGEPSGALHVQTDVGSVSVAAYS